MCSVALPALKDVKGAFTVKSNEDLTKSCANFQDKAGSNNAIKGTYTCDGNQEVTSTTSNGSTGTSGDSSTSSTGAASGYYVPAATTGLMGIIAAIFGLL